MKEVQLSKGFVAIVDDEDFDELNKRKWYAGKCGNKIYARADIGPAASRSRLFMHRIILDVTDKKLKVDHVNGNTLDNQKSNLRLASQKENIRNRNGTRIGNTSGYRGVWFHKINSKWIAEITVDNKKISLGSFSDKEDAARAFDKAAKLYFGEFCGKLNFS
jgi:hypothetical protein